MTNIEEIYRELTNVDIELQWALWDNRGKGYYGEFLVFRELYPNLPGNCKILMNINIPSFHGKTTEIDLLLIHETGLYVFEMKHYKGTIYGKPHEPTWTQYFRAAPNQSFRNPVSQNQYHISNLQKIVHDIPIHSFIVFTSDECDLKVECNEPNISICTLSSLRYNLNILSERPATLNMEQIDHIFRTLLPYSPTSQQSVNVDGKEMPFHEYASAISTSYAERAKQLETDCQKKIKETEADCELQKIRSKATTRTAIISAILATMVSIILNILVCTQYKHYSNEQIAVAQQELAAFAQKFEHVEEYNNGEIRIASPLVQASEVILKKSNDIANTVDFSCTLNWTGTNYGVQLAEDTKYIIIRNDGSVKEYNLFNADFPYYPTRKLGKGTYTKFDLPEREFYELEVSDIAYIKLINVRIWKYQVNYGNALFKGYEIELYRAE